MLAVNCILKCGVKLVFCRERKNTYSEICIRKLPKDKCTEAILREEY